MSIDTPINLLKSFFLIAWARHWLTGLKQNQRNASGRAQTPVFSIPPESHTKMPSRFLPSSLVFSPFAAQQLELLLRTAFSAFLFRGRATRRKPTPQQSKHGIQEFMTQAAFPMSQKFSSTAHCNVNSLPVWDDVIQDGNFLNVLLFLLITLWGRVIICNSIVKF